MHRYELSDRQWDRIASFFPHRTHDGNVGHPFNDPRSLVNGILWMLHTGAPWRGLPERYGPVGNRLRPLQCLAQGRHLEPYRHLAAGRTG